MKTVAKEFDVDKYWQERWKEVKDDFWGDLRKSTALVLKTLLESSMEVQVQDLIGAGYWEHSRFRYGYRNGYCNRTLAASVGEIYGLRVPRVRGRQIKYSIIPKYKRRAKDADQLVLKMFLAGVSTRRVADIGREKDKRANGVKHIKEDKRSG